MRCVSRRVGVRPSALGLPAGARRAFVRAKVGLPPGARRVFVRAKVGLPPGARSAFVRAKVGASVVLLVLAATPLSSESLALVHRQRYAMGTMFDVVVYHGSRAEAEQAIERALDEIVRLDQVLSHFKADSDLSRLVRDGRQRSVSVDPSLYDILQQSIAVSRLSGGKFDVTIAPLLRTWRRARDEGREPSAAEIAQARRCVGYEKIDAAEPGYLRLRSDCLEIDLGGIGKGYAVDRALAILTAADIRHAVVNAGGSSIASAGTPPSDDGWPVALGPAGDRRRTMWLRDSSMSTSEQNGEILDPRTGTAASSGLVITVVGSNAAVADALSTTLVLLSIEDGKALLRKFPGVSAMWMTRDGEIRTQYAPAAGARRRPASRSADEPGPPSPRLRRAAFASKPREGWREAARSAAAERARATALSRREREGASGRRLGVGPQAQ